MGVVIASSSSLLELLHHKRWVCSCECVECGMEQDICVIMWVWSAGVGLCSCGCGCRCGLQEWGKNHVGVVCRSEAVFMWVWLRVWSVGSRSGEGHLCDHVSVVCWSGAVFMWVWLWVWSAGVGQDIC